MLPFLIPLGQFLVTFLAERLLPTSQLVHAQNFVQTVVSGIDQGMQNSTGPDKKQAALEATSAILAHYHINVPPQLIDALIEEAVFMLHAGQESSAVSASSSVGFVPQSDATSPAGVPALRWTPPQSRYFRPL
jgi:hypothetical protein